MHGLPVGWLIDNLGRAIAVNTDFVAMNDLKARLIGAAKVSGRVSLKYVTILVFSARTPALSSPLHRLPRPPACTWEHLE